MPIYRLHRGADIMIYLFRQMTGNFISTEKGEVKVKQYCIQAALLSDEDVDFVERVLQLIWDKSKSCIVLMLLSRHTSATVTIIRRCYPREKPKRCISLVAAIARKHRVTCRYYRGLWNLVSTIEGTVPLSQDRRIHRCCMIFIVDQILARFFSTLTVLHHDGAI